MKITAQTINFNQTNQSFAIYVVPKDYILLLSKVYIFAQQNTQGLNFYIGSNTNPINKGWTIAGTLESNQNQYDVFFPSQQDSQGRYVLTAGQTVYITINQPTARIGSFVFELFGILIK